MELRGELKYAADLVLRVKQRAWNMKHLARALVDDKAAAEEIESWYNQIDHLLEDLIATFDEWAEARRCHECGNPFPAISTVSGEDEEFCSLNCLQIWRDRLAEAQEAAEEDERFAREFPRWADPSLFS